MEETKEEKAHHLEVISPERVEELINKISEDTPENNDIKEEGVDLEVVKKVVNTLSGQTAETAVSALTSAATLLPVPMLWMMITVLKELLESLSKESFLEILEILHKRKGK